MESALMQLTRILRSTGMDDKEIDHLLGRFLQEEAFEYVDYINECLENSEPEEIVIGTSDNIS